MFTIAMRIAQRSSVMPGLEPGIHVFPAIAQTWMAGTSASEATRFFERLRPAMTICSLFART
jgi:hypothetical protein